MLLTVLIRGCARIEIGIRRSDDARDVEIAPPDMHQRGDVRVRVRLDRSPDPEDKTHVRQS